MKKLPVVLVPGLWLCLRHYDPLVGFLGDQGFSLSHPASYPFGLSAKAAELKERVMVCSGGCLLVCHSFGTLVAHKMLDLFPETRGYAHGLISLSGISPRGFEPRVIRKILCQYPIELLLELSRPRFRVPSLKIMQALLGPEATEQDWGCLHAEDPVMMRKLIFRALFGIQRPLVHARLSGPKLFLSGREDRLVTPVSVARWEKHYEPGMNSQPQFLPVGGSHLGILSDPQALAAIAQWLDAQG